MSASALEVSARLKQIRHHLGITQAEFAAGLGISRGFLSGIEAGTTKPSVESLIGVSLTYKQFSLEWLLTGEGEMFRGSGPDSGPGHPQSSAAQPSVDPLVAEVEELRSIARRGSQAGAWHIMRALEQAGQPLTRMRLLRELGGEPADVDADLHLLRRVGLIMEQAGHWTRTEKGLRTTNALDGAQLALYAVDILLREVMPAADRRDGTGKIAAAEVFVPSGTGADVVQQLLRLIKLHSAELPPGPERVVLVLGAAVTKGDDHA